MQATFGAEVACLRRAPQAGTKVSLPKKFWCPTTRRWRPSGATGLGAIGTRKQQYAGAGLTRLRRRLRVETARCAGTIGPTGKRRGCNTQCPREHPVVTTRLRSSLRFALVLATRRSTDACYTPSSPALCFGFSHHRKTRLTLTPWSTLEEGRQCLKNWVLKKTLCGKVATVGKEVVAAMKVLVIRHSDQSRRRHDVQGVVGLPSCLPSSKSLLPLPTIFSLIASLLAPAVGTAARVLRAAPQEERVAEVAGGLGPCDTTMSLISSFPASPRRTIQSIKHGPGASLLQRQKG